MYMIEASQLDLTTVYYSRTTSSSICVDFGFISIEKYSKLFDFLALTHGLITQRKMSPYMLIVDSTQYKLTRVTRASHLNI